MQSPKGFLSIKHFLHYPVSKEVKKQNLENFYPRRKRTGHYKIFSFGAGFALFMEPPQLAAGYSASQNKTLEISSPIQGDGALQHVLLWSRFCFFISSVLIVSVLFMVMSYLPPIGHFNFAQTGQFYFARE